MRVLVMVFFAAVACRAPASAGAWTLPPGRSLAILKSDQGVELGAAPAPIAQQSVTLFVEHGLTDTLSIELKTGVQMNGLAGVRRTGPSEQALGVKRRLAHWRNVVASGYLGERVLFDLGVGPFAKDRPDWRTEARGLVGANFRLFGHDGYADLETMVLYGGGARMQVREESTVGVGLVRATSVTLSLRQGQDQRETYRSSWSTQEATAVRAFGRWRVEAGWRRTTTFPSTTVTTGPVFAVWRSF